MTKKIYIVIGLIVSILDGLMFLCYPIHNSWLGTVSVARILKNLSEPDGLWVLGGFVYALSCILMLTEVIKADGGDVKIVGTLLINK